MKKIFKIMIFSLPLLAMYSCVGEDLSDIKPVITENNNDNNNKQTNTTVPEGCVDLGLSVYWSNKNLGASKPEEAGKTYSIGYPLTESLPEKYDIVHTKYDTAVKEWGEPWRMPTSSELYKLISECTWTYEVRNGVQGFKVTGTNGNSIFVPKGNINKKPYSSMGDISCAFWTGTHYNTYYFSYSYYYVYIYLYDDDTIKKQVEKGWSDLNRSYTENSESHYYELYIRPVQDK